MLKDWFHGVQRSWKRRKVRRQLVKRFGSRETLRKIRIDFKPDCCVQIQSMRTSTDNVLRNKEKPINSKSDDG